MQTVVVLLSAVAVVAAVPAHPLNPDETSSDPKVVELNPKQRLELQHAIVKVEAKIEAVSAELAENNCPENPLPHYSPSEVCRNLTKQQKRLRETLTVMRGCGLVDDQVHREDMPEHRDKRDAALTKIADELRRIAEEKSPEKLAAAEKRRETVVDFPAKRACSNPNAGLSQRAVNAGHTIEVSGGGGVGVLISASLSFGTAYGQNGEYGCISSRCWGFETNIGISAGASEGYYYHFNDVAGDSKVVTGTVGWGPFAYTFGTIKSGSRKIGYISGFSGGWSWLPVSIGVFNCRTDMTRGPSCRVYTESYNQKYYTTCWSWKGFRCTRHRKAYRKRVRC